MHKRDLARRSSWTLIIVLGCLVSPSACRAQSLPSAGPSSKPVLSNRGLGLLVGLGSLAWAGQRYSKDHDRIVEVLDRSRLDPLIDIGDDFGSGVTAGVGTAALLLGGHLGRNPAMTALGKDLTTSLLASWSVVWALKMSVNATRPNGGRYSFPSGHTATAFTTAPIICKHLGRTAGIAAFTLATGTALGRMEDRKHYLTDVLFGAAIGLAIGCQVADGRSGGGFMRHFCISPSGVGFSLVF